MRSVDGLALSIVLIKFQILPMLLLVALIKRRWCILTGFATGLLLLFSISLPFLGISGWTAYFKLLRAMPSFLNQYGFAASHGYCIRGQLYALLIEHHPQTAMFLTVILMLAMTAWLLWSWKGPWLVTSASFDLKMAATIIIALLTSPLINFHDLAFLILPLFLICGFTLSRPAPLHSSRLIISVSAAVFYFLPPIQLAVRHYYPVQIVVWGLVGLLWILFSHVKAAQIESHDMIKGHSG